MQHKTMHISLYLIITIVWAGMYKGNMEYIILCNEILFSRGNIMHNRCVGMINQAKLREE